MMMRVRSRILATTAAGAAGLLAVVAGIAWACSPQPSYYGLSPESGRPGDPVTVSGGGFTTAVPIEIKWNDVTGPTLGRATGPNFAVRVTVPQAPAGVYYIIALQPGGVGKAQAAFRVTSEPVQGGGAQSGTAPEPAAGQEGQNQTGSPSQPGSTQPAAAPSAPSTAGSSAPGSSPAGAPVNQAEGAYNLGTGQPAAVGEPRPQTAASPRTQGAEQATRAPPRAPQPAGAPAPQGAQGPAAPVPPAAVAEDEAPALRSPAVGTGVVAGDLWGGFEGRFSGSSSAIGRPVDSQGASSTSLIAGATLLSLGLVALLAGFGLAEAGRRRARGRS